MLQKHVIPYIGSSVLENLMSISAFRSYMIHFL